jgi:hypothetical protein
MNRTIAAVAALALAAAPALASAQSWGQSYGYGQDPYASGYDQGYGAQGDIANALLGGLLGGGQQAYGYQDQCASQQRNRQILGAVVGGAAGAALGRSAAGRDNRSTGQIAGGVLGAVVGYQLGKRTVNCAPQQTGWNNNGWSGWSQGSWNGWQTPSNVYNSGYGQPACGMGRATVTAPNGRSETRDVWMCQANDGRWYPTDR